VEGTLLDKIKGYAHSRGAVQKKWGGKVEKTGGGRKNWRRRVVD